MTTPAEIQAAVDRHVAPEDYIGVPCALTPLANGNLERLLGAVMEFMKCEPVCTGEDHGHAYAQPDDLRAALAAILGGQA